MADFPEEAQNAIENHGIIGDMRSAALIADTGSIDFCCWPDFDSPSIFTALLDTNDAGIFQLAPDLPDARRLQIYLPDTNVLQTRWISEEAVVEVTDLMPIGEDQDDLPRIVRRVQVRFGKATIRMRCKVRMDYSRADTTAHQDGSDVCFQAEGQPG
ncbi:trehalase-like domain-containing protein, partial [Pseudomonas viridiflava]|uniref:trehalase-like domain-containing protein n=3 Tax=Pseudomonas TaxID=286 RepID=UPI001F11AF3D